MTAIKVKSSHIIKWKMVGFLRNFAGSKLRQFLINKKVYSYSAIDDIVTDSHAFAGTHVLIDARIGLCVWTNRIAV